MIYLVKIDKDVFKHFLHHSNKSVSEKLLNLPNSKNNDSFILTSDINLIYSLGKVAKLIVPINKSILGNIKNIENSSYLLNKDSFNLKQGLIVVDSNKYVSHPGVLGLFESNRGYINAFSYNTSYKNNKIINSLSIQSTNSNTNFALYKTKSGLTTRILSYDKVWIHSNIRNHPYRTPLSNLFTFSLEEKIEVVTEFGKKSNDFIYLDNNLLSTLALQNKKNSTLGDLDKNFIELRELCESIILANKMCINGKQLMEILIKFHNHHKYYDANFIYYDTDIMGNSLISKSHSFSFWDTGE